MAIVSYDEAMGIQAIAMTAPDLPPESTRIRARIRTLSCYRRISSSAGIAPENQAAVHALVKDRHRSREFIEFLKLLRRRPTHMEDVCRGSSRFPPRSEEAFPYIRKRLELLPYESMAHWDLLATLVLRAHRRRRGPS